MSLTAATDVECTVQFSFYLIFLGFFFEFQVFVQNISKEKVVPTLTEFTLNNISFVDITHHANTSLNIVPSYYQAQVALLYDNSYLYVASKLKDPYTAGNARGFGVGMKFEN